MPAQVVVTVSSRIPEIRGTARRLAEVVVAKAALDIEAQAKARAPVRTGFLRSSIAASGAGLEWQVSVGAAYAVFVEFGTSRMAARPYLVPAVEAVAPGFIDALAKVVR